MRAYFLQSKHYVINLISFSQQALYRPWDVLPSSRATTSRMVRTAGLRGRIYLSPNIKSGHSHARPMHLPAPSRRRIPRFAYRVPITPQRATRPAIYRHTLVMSLSARGKAEGTRHVIEHFHDDPTMRKWHLSTPIPFGATCLGQGVVNFSDSSHDATSCTLVPYHEGARDLFALIPIPLSAFARVTAPQSKPLSWTSTSSSTSPASTGPTAGLRGRSLTHVTTCSTSIRGPFSL